MKKNIYRRNTTMILKFGKHLQKLRTERNISQLQLAEKANFSFTYISKIETGYVNTSLSHLIAIADALDIPMKQLFDFDKN
jgi:transcriptional regulator with XRE-family HTH domain